MDANRKKIVVVGAAAVAALVLILVVVLFFLGGESEPKPVAIKPPAPPAVGEEKPEDKPAATEEAAAPAAKTPSGTYAVKKGATLEDIAARPEVYGKADNWWSLWQANPDAVSYAFEQNGKWVAIVRPGNSLKIPTAKALSESEKAGLTSKISPYAVQFGSFPDAGEAQALVAKLSADKSMDFYITQRTVDGVRYNRVRAGLFKSFAAADKFGESTASAGKADDYLAVEPLGEELRAQNAALLKKYKGGE